MDQFGPIPPWRPDSRKRRKPGESRGAWIWPRDKDMNDTPLTCWRRWKDLFTGKGPAIFVGDRTTFDPTRPVWSNWPEFDNLFYREAQRHDWTPPEWWQNKKYDFSEREYTEYWRNDPNVWSDVKWGKNPQNPNGRAVPLYCRDSVGRESTIQVPDAGMLNNGPDGNDFRYRPGWWGWDWNTPFPLQWWQPWLR